MVNKKIWLGITAKGYFTKKAVLFSALALVMAYTACAQQYDSESDFQVTLLGDGKSLEITKYVGEKQIVNIPPSIEGISVTKIGDRAFMDKTGITKVTIPAGVTAIGNSAFSYNAAKINDYMALTTVTFAVGSQLTSIGNNAFDGCTSLTSITIPASVTVIGNNAFGVCRSLANITVDGKNPNYASEGRILYNKAKTELIKAPPAGISGAVTIPNTVTSIGSWAFRDCTSLTSITIPASVTSIGQLAFQNCTSLASINIPLGVTIIGKNAFFNCTKLTNITVSTNNPNYASEGGMLLNKAKTQLIAYPAASGAVTIPNTVMSINYFAFQNCSSLTVITIPSSITSIGEQAFSGCTGLS